MLITNQQKFCIARTLFRSNYARNADNEQMRYYNTHIL